MNKNYILSPTAMRTVEGSSKGTQPKYFQDGYWYKINNVGYEGLAERLTSLVLSCSNVDNYVKYEQCTIDGHPGCRSKNFLKEGESFLSFQRLYDIFVGGDLSAQIIGKNEVSDRIEYVKNFIETYTGLDVSRYLSQILTLDMLTLNTDRHFHNLGIIADENQGIYKPAPIFDNGNALLSDWQKFDEETIEENIDKVYGQPFSASLERQAYEVGFGLQLDYQKLYSLLSNEKDTRALDVLYYQLEHCRKYIPNFDSRKSIDVQLQEAREMNQKEYGNIAVIVQNTDIEK